MDDGREVVQIDENTETLAHVLTLVMHKINSDINLGITYEQVVTFAVHMIHEPIEPKDIEATASSIASAILDNRKSLGKDQVKH